MIAGDVSADFADYRAEVEALIDRLGMRNHVHFVGAQSRVDLAALMRHAQALLVPSHSETFGLVALEGAASGVPVLASSTGGLREVVVHEETGYLMHDRDPAAWGVDAAPPPHRTNPFASRLGVVARVHARRFYWPDIGVRLATAYERIAAREGVRRLHLVRPPALTSMNTAPGRATCKRAAPTGDGPFSCDEISASRGAPCGACSSGRTSAAPSDRGRCDGSSW
jgi:hypothetical protein